MDIDFGYGQNTNTNEGNSVDANNDVKGATNLTNGNIEHNPEGTYADDLNDNTNNVNTTDTNDDNSNRSENNNDTNNEGTREPLQPGTSIEVDGNTYTVDDNGNIIDANGNIFVEANGVNEWLDSFDNVNDVNDSININSIRDAIGVDILDENNESIEYENTPEGISAYVNAVIETSRQEHYEAAINTLYQRYPILNDVLNYYIANGNSLEGYGQMPDRSNIVVDDNNETQQEAIIRTAWIERGQKGDVDGYIAYLKSSGTLLATAKEELAAIQEYDEQRRQNLADEAENVENERIQQLQDYWVGVAEAIESRNLAGYQIPESIIINRNGQKLSVTPNDFFAYIYRVDETGKSAYEHDLEAETPESRRDDELLRAYLKFVGGNYSNLVDMAINKNEVAKLRLKAKERNSSTIRINRPKNATAKNAEIDLGYN